MATIAVQSKTSALRLSLLAILTVVGVEGAAGLLVNSLALVTDAAHAAFDSVTTLVLLLTTRWSLRPADEEHTYGHGKVESIGGFAGGMTLLALSGILAFEAALRLAEGGKPVTPGLVGFGAVLYTISVDFFRIGVLRTASRAGASVTVRADLFHALSDLSSTIVAFIGLYLSSLGYFVGDSMAAIVLSVLLVYLSSKLIYTSSLELTDAVPRDMVREARRQIASTEGVLVCKDLRMRKVGGKTFVETVIAVPDHVGVDEAHGIASRVEANLERLLGDCKVGVHVEPTDWAVPIEAKIQRLVHEVEGVKDIHNLAITSTRDGLYVTLHVQVDPKTPLAEAHQVAEQVESILAAKIENAHHVTVHLESSKPETSTGERLFDVGVLREVQTIVGHFKGVRRLGEVTTFKSDGKLHINVRCSFDAQLTIDQVHEMISSLEQRIRRRFSSAVVTVHPEPA